MMIKFLLIILLLFTSTLFGKVLTIDDKTKIYDVLPSAQIYIDKTRKLTIDDITTKDIQFEDNDKKQLLFGYSPDFNVWVKFTLKNDSDKTIHKVLEYANPLTTHIDLFDIKENIIYKDGLFQINTNRKTVNPYFKLEFKPTESKIFYLKLSSDITTMILQLNLYDTHEFYNKELMHQSILQLFFGAMLILAVYNLFIYFFSKDISYLFYVFYVLGVILHQLLYTGISYVYVFSQDIILYIIRISPIASAIPIIALALFCKVFLKTEQYPRYNKILNIFLFIVPFVAIFTIAFSQWDNYRNIASMLLVVFLIILTFYAFIKRNRQAYFIIGGWFLIGLATLLMYLNSIGLFNIYKYCPYFIEISFLLESLLFSIALADKINHLQLRLITQKKTENERLELQVTEQTKDLKLSLNEKTLLLQELNHRVKNNMQMMVSLIRLQTNDVDDEKIQNMFLTTENRLNAMSHLHEMLYKKDDISYINAYEYFSTLIEGLQETYTQDIKINYKIDIDLETEQAISCGIILNELVTNSLKYAFTKGYGDKEISISLSKKDDTYMLVVKDNGVGYDQKKISKSFGLILVTTLVESKLFGTLNIDSKDGVTTKIIWREEDE